MLRNLNTKSVYNSDDDNLLKDFYIPALSVANLYQRSVGYFSAITLTYAAQGFSVFVENGGTIELIVGAFVSEREYEAVVSGYDQKNIANRLGEIFVDEISHNESTLFQCRLQALAWLIKNNSLSIKVALRPNGLFHEKVGILSDANGDKLVFSGSANETDKALLPGYNFESINVFQSWRSELADHWAPHVSKFEHLWENRSPNTAIIDFPEAAHNKLVQITQQSASSPSINGELIEWAKFLGKPTNDLSSKKPKLPDKIHGRDFKIKKHQTLALQKWRANDFVGILALATGAGKTITSIYGIVQIASKIENLVVVIAVPYQNLADQWCDVLSLFNIFPIKCYRSSSLWLDRLSVAAHYSQTEVSGFTAIVVVNRTLKTPSFQTLLNKFNPEKLMFIGDECHHHGSLSFEGYLPVKARFRLGLSATPEHYLDEERNVHLESVYGKIVDTFTLKQAVEAEILTPYRYTVIPISLTPDEAERYVSLSIQIGRMYAASKNSGHQEESIEPLQTKLRERSRIVASAQGKLPALRTLLRGFSQPIRHSLFYCGDGMVDLDEFDDGEFGIRQIEAVSTILHDEGWSNSHFTARENNKQRDEILRSFKDGYIKSLVAIKCLDEGIDIPACSTAFILASSRDPRQFIQRRGRILRRSPDKDIAEIFDFLVLLPEVEDDERGYSRRLLIGELERVAEFASLSQNQHECYTALRPILLRYSLEHLL